MTRGRKRRTRKAVDRRSSSSARGYDARWRAARYAFLMLPENALCRICAADGVLAESTVVDHVKPHRGDFALFWDRSNWQPLCESCHNRKTATEDGGFGNAAKETESND